ncbi:transporter, cation channel family protein [Dictyocaulus viviparus]|uniref:Transporter, cation channel family protein n=1 Tax=Dictyocaulus viviparus TaxID=29172 RepID=A0A0D8XAK8_DICVI|nr:transporter, cation channel family protein [Dictyocaulus viviparus]
MLQQPVPELRSFQSLSKYAGGSRSVLGRRTSNAFASRRLSQCKKRFDDLEAIGSASGSKETVSEAGKGTIYGPSTSRLDKQVEWQEEESTENSDDLPYPGFAEPALRCLKQTQPPRSWALTLVMSPWFDRITMIVILINCITLGMYRPCDDGPDCTTYRCHILALIDHAIFAYFAVEMIIKIVALGFTGPAAYMSDTWNRLDFFIVIAGIAEFLLQEYLGGNINLTAIRTVRVLRPLRAVNRIPSMRILVNLLLDTLPMLGNVLLLCFFVFFIFGIIGVQLWAGLLRNRCVINLPRTVSENQSTLFNKVKLTRFYIPEDTSLEYICSHADANGLHTCSNLPPYTVDGIKCNLTIDDYDKVNNKSCINWNIYYNECQVMQRNPFQGSVSFDNIGFAWVAIFLIGAFFMINLCLVVIATQFAETKRRETERMLQERKRLQSRMPDSISGNESDICGTSSKDGGDTVYTAIVRFIGHTFKRTKRTVKKKFNAYMKQRREKKKSEAKMRRKSKLDDMATLSRIEERTDEEEDIESTTDKTTERRRSRKVTIDEEQDKIGNGSAAGHMESNAASEEVVTTEDEWSDTGNCKLIKKQPPTPSKVHMFREKIRRFVVCDHFTRGILVAILVNTLSMGVEYHQQPEILTIILEYSNLFFTGLFAFEMILKVIADGLFGYLSDGFNLFDGGIVALRRIPTGSVDQPEGSADFIVMVVVYNRAKCSVGMVFFGYKFCNHNMTDEQCTCQQIFNNECTCDRMNFDTFLHATVTVFQILTQEDWNMVLFNGMAQTNPWAALYFVALMTFGNYVLFNLLVAILVEGFQESKEEEKRQQEEDAKKKAQEEEDERKKELELLLAKSTSSMFLNGTQGADCTCMPRLTVSVPKNDENGGPAHRQRIHSWSGLCQHFNPHCPTHGRRALLEAYAREKFLEASHELEQALAEEERRTEQKENTCFRKLLRKTCLHRKTEYSLFCFGPKNSFRIRCLQLTQKKWFDYSILIFIGINCITLAMERPSIPPNSLERKFLTLSGYVFTSIFSIEMAMKVIANGCVLGRGAYFKDGWNILDGILVIISLVNVLFELFATGDSPKIFGVIRVLRLLRALRPLRVINRAPGVKLVVMTLISSLKPIGNIVLICCTFFIIFGILGVQLFKGMMFHCVGPEITNVTNKADCLADVRNKWVNHRYNFDNLGQALMSLFVLSSKDGWVSIMYQGIDAVGVDIQPIENYNEWRMIYFISFLLLVGFFVLNMFVGVVVENFHKCKEALEKEMREKAKEKRLQRRMKRQKYEESIIGKRKKVKKTHPYWHNYGTTRMFLNSVVTSKYFDLAIAAVIGINVISMAMEFYMMPNGLKYVLKALNYFFTAVFTLEAAMKLAALGDFCSWNRLDMFIVFLSVAGIIFEEFEALELPINPTIIRVMRVLRIARGLKKFLKVELIEIEKKNVGNLGSLFFLLFFIFAALGVELFGKLECSEDHPCDGLGEHAHFKNFGMAFLTLFRIATGDNWNGIMKDALRDDCDSSERCETNCCVDPILAPCFFVIFVLISQFVLVNVVVAVLMKHLEESNKRDADAINSQERAADTDNSKDTNIDDENAEDVSINELEQELIEVEHLIDEEIRRRESISQRDEAEIEPLCSSTKAKNDLDRNDNHEQSLPKRIPCTDFIGMTSASMSSDSLRFE